MTTNKSEIDINEYLTLHLDAIGKVFAEGPSSPAQNPAPMTPEEGINYVASVYPPDNPITKHIQDNLIDGMADIAGVDIANDADRLKFLQDLQQKISQEGIDALDPALLDYLQKQGQETHTAVLVYSIEDDGSRTLIAASFDGRPLDIEALQQDKPDQASMAEHIFDKFFDGELPEQVGSSNGGALPESATPKTPEVPAPTMDPAVKIDNTFTPGGGGGPN